MSVPQGANSSDEYELHSRKIIKMLDGSHSCQILYLPNPSACCNTWTNKKKTMPFVSVKVAGTPKWVYKYIPDLSAEKISIKLPNKDFKISLKQDTQIYWLTSAVQIP